MPTQPTPPVSPGLTPPLTPTQRDLMIGYIAHRDLVVGGYFDTTSYVTVVADLWKTFHTGGFGDAWLTQAYDDTVQNYFTKPVGGSSGALGNLEKQGPAGPVGPTIAQAGQDVWNAANAIPKFLELLSRGSTWVRVAEFTVGGVLIAVAMNAALKGNNSSPVPKKLSFAPSGAANKAFRSNGRTDLKAVAK